MRWAAGTNNVRPTSYDCAMAAPVVLTHWAQRMPHQQPRTRVESLTPQCKDLYRERQYRPSSQWKYIIHPENNGTILR